MRLLSTMPLAGILLFWTGHAFAFVCGFSPEPYSAARFSQRMYDRLFQGGIIYLIVVSLVVAIFYSLKRFKPAFSEKTPWFVGASGLISLYALMQRFASPSWYCTRITGWQEYAESAVIWCALSITFYLGYRLITRVDERYRPLVVLGAPIGTAIALPAMSFLAYVLRQ
jgi:hypothetical protein